MALPGSLTCATLNVRGLAHKRRQSQLYRLLTDLDIDVLAVQETKVDGDEETRSMVQRYTTRYFAFVSHAVGMSAGCVLFVRKLPGLVVQEVKSGMAGRFVSCDVLFGSVEWRVVCVYAPNLVNDRTVFFENIWQHLNTERIIILMGDFNCVLSSRDKTSARAYRDSSTDILAQVINECNLADVEECLEGTREVQYTHFQGSSHARLDRIYLALDLIEKCEDYSVMPVSFSDHCLVQCRIGGQKRRNGFTWELWKLNAKLLQDEVFVEDVEDRIKEMEGDQNNLGEKWELCKQEIKMKAIE
ncbi:unnamed protein product, partial [Ixodes hexagonus]